MTTGNVIFAGVGGQGTLLASRLLGHVLINLGRDVKMSEVHGMSQRGGSVITFVRWGDSVASPVVELGQADVIVAFELLEALRSLPYLAKDGALIVSEQEIDPMPVITGAATYPAGVVADMKKRGATVISLDALTLAIEAGSPKAVNTVLLGVMAKRLGSDSAPFLDAIDHVVAKPFIEMNKDAFLKGFSHS